MPVKKNKKSEKGASTVAGRKKAEKQQLSSPSTSKSPGESREISSYFSSPPTSKSPQTDDKQPMRIPSEKITSEVENKQDKVTNRTEKDNKPNNQEDQQGESSQQDHENKPKNTAALRQQLLSPKKDSDAGKKKKSKKRSNKKDETSKQSEITSHFPVRRSQRKCKSKLEEEKRKSLEEAILEGKEEGLEVRKVEGKGRGVFASKTFERGDLVCEYAGELIDLNTAKEREEKYSLNKDIGCYMYYFVFGNKKYCVDATSESGRIGRLLNHSISGNCTTKVISIKDDPYLILVASKHIKPGEELLYDYGERNKDAIASHPWLQL